MPSLLQRGASGTGAPEYALPGGFVKIGVEIGVMNRSVWSVCCWKTGEPIDDGIVQVVEYLEDADRCQCPCTC